MRNIRPIFTRLIDPKYQKYKDWCESFNATGYVKLNHLNPCLDLAWMKNTRTSGSVKDTWNIPCTFGIPSRGVRSSLYSIFSYLSEKYPNITAIIPSDVYPVYQQIINNKISFNTYESMGDISYWRKTLKDVRTTPEVLLVTNPTIPTGKHLSKSYIDLLTRWVQKPNRWIIVDAVYNYTDNLSQSLIGPRIFWCTSLSKTFLSPEQAGIISINDENIISDLKSYVEAPVSDAKDIISQNSFLPAKQQLLFDARWKSLQRKYPRLINTVPDNGYMCVVPVKFETLLNEEKIIGIPATVFGSTSENKTVLSCLGFNDLIEDYYYFTTASNFASCYDKYSRLFYKNEKYTYHDKFFLCTSDNLDPGITKAQHLLNKTNIPGDSIIAIRTHQKITEFERGYSIINSCKINVDDVSIIEEGQLRKVTVEDVYSLSLKINNTKLYSWKNTIPRTFSILPIAKGCQAKCPFCFSHGSISNDQLSGNYETRLQYYIDEAHKHYVQRAVITGGGEPTMLSHEKLLNLISSCNKFKTIVLITNAYKYAQMSEEDRFKHLSQLRNAGLNVLSISRHGSTIDENYNIMQLQIESEKVARTALTISGLRVRWVCVLQKTGVNDRQSLEKYLTFVSQSGVNEICFKELYVSSSYESVYHDSRSNEYSRENQVPLSLIINYATNNNWKLVDTLPWGSPIYEGQYQGHKLKVAAYTEPSVYWERNNGICRSWNLMSDSTCYASLEDKTSLI